MKLNPENIIRLLTAASGKGATAKEILIALAQKKRRKTQLRKILKDLSNKKICYKRNNRYYMQDQAVSPASTNKIKHVPPTGSRHRNQNRGQLGFVFYQSLRQVIYSFSGKKEYRIAKGNQNLLHHGDLVKFSLVKSKNGDTEASLIELVVRRITLVKGKLHKEKKGRLVFFPSGKNGPKQYKVLNSINIKKDQQLDVWLDIAESSLLKRAAEGYVRLPQENVPEKSPILENILVSNKIPSRFPEKVLAACNSLPKSVRMGKNSKRIDLRHLPFVTIDGEDAKDFDDAIYAQKEKEHYRLWVSIADVAEYVPPRSILDVEAFCRGTSTYFPGTAFPMLPERLSNGLCSLKEGLNRYTLTCETLIDEHGKMLSRKIYPSINRIVCRLTYTAVDQFYQTGSIKTRKTFPGMGDHLLLYKEIALVLRAKRIKSGFITFHLPESVFKYDRQNRVIDCAKSYQTDAMQVIEQFMLQANEAVAKFCDKKGIPIVWRNHPPPMPDKQKQLQQMLWNNHIKLPRLSTSKDYNLALSLINNSPEKDYLEYAMLRSMSLAVYETTRLGHFGIASSFYCHFTSPIRRYPDLMVHRALKRYFLGKRPENIPEYIAATASERERLATAAERSATRYYKLILMSDKIGEFFDGRLSGFINSGLFVEIEHPYVEGFVSYASIQDDYYEYDEELHCIWGKENRSRFTIGKRMRVLLTKLDWHNLSPEFDWICWIDEV